jgi:hypothetical protein
MCCFHVLPINFDTFKLPVTRRTIARYKRTLIQYHTCMSTKKIGVTNTLISVITSTLLILATVSVSLGNGTSSIAFAQRPLGPFGENRVYTFGMISSVQDDNNGKPHWILNGFWKTNLINQTSNASGAVFNTSFRMIMTNGSGMHTHTITDFVLKNKSMPNKSTREFNGTASASLREGIVTNVPISIKIMDNNIISIWLDPAKVKNHFGNTPIFGAVSKNEHGVPPNIGMPVR